MDRLVITADLGRLKIYRVTQDLLSDPKPSIDLVRDWDLSDKHSRFDRRDTDQAGRFPRGTSNRDTTGMSYGERHNDKTKAEQSQLQEIADSINQSVRSDECDGFYLAAPQTIHQKLLDSLLPEVRESLVTHLPVDLIKAPKMDLLQRFKLVE